jgi:hypothetical protein
MKGTCSVCLTIQALPELNLNACLKYCRECDASFNLSQ